MRQPPLPFTRDLVLIGGGHTHALVLRRWGMKPLPGVRVTLVNPGPTAPYSGMLPGFVAGHYPRDALDIDLVRLARFADARLVLGAVDAIDLAGGEIHVPGRPALGFDIASVDIGITSDMPGLPGFAEHAVPAKPLGAFAMAWESFVASKAPSDIVVIGAGVAGAELSMAMAHRMRHAGRPAQVRLLERGTAFSGLPARSAARLRHALSVQGVNLQENAEIRAITTEGVVLDDDTSVRASFVTGAAGARPYPWLAKTGLALRDGFIRVDGRLRSSDPRIFAVGDCAHMDDNPRPKAGVYAVRQAPVLFDNLRAALAETGGMRQYRPQRDYLKLISLGGKSALADRFGLTLAGPALWRWKDSIDRSFMDKFRDLPAMQSKPLPWPRAAGLREAVGPKPMCGGCGAKVGRASLREALAGLPSGTRDDTLKLPGDDAACLSLGGVRQVLSTDHLRAVTEDPVLMARIAAHHALGDIWAMGAQPQAALASIILPRMSDMLARRSLSEILEAAAEVMAAAGAEIVGGHSTLGDELTIGFTVTGLCDTDPLTLAGARPGDTLILTKPIGSGVLMAAEMTGAAAGEDVAAAYRLMVEDQGRAANLLRHAHAMTDITGFGLAGHLLNICEASGVGAELALDAVPLFPGALALARAGTRSTLFAQNRAALPWLPDTPRHDLLFDPQTAGGLLAACPGDPDDTLSALRQAGYGAAAIGRITGTTGQISIV
ncbi:selenide, water dikinase SelD [Thalassococcus sp. CAU 1522]|uniref:Selenide, water dikinase SelD n=1 Tax=Thalassococcus arenae TaxID=2851652 RepID=A0ABS6N3M0_9RHOB|nr:selenide, water dikinase SelD [Thalassococcus arenae]MBV2358616.1 selenide, water dikinase SelD [Thalassococcus arenae]